MIWGAGGSKSRLPRAAGAEPFGQLRQENVQDCEAARQIWAKGISCLGHVWKLSCSKKCTAALWCEGHAELKTHEAFQLRSALGSWAVENVRHPCGAKHMLKPKLRSTLGSEHFWNWDVQQVRCRVAVTIFVPVCLTPHFALHTLRALHSGLCTWHCTLSTPHFAFHTLHTTLYVILLFYPSCDLHSGSLVSLVLLGWVVHARVPEHVFVHCKKHCFLEVAMPLQNMKQFIKHAMFLPETCLAECKACWILRYTYLYIEQN